MKVLARATICPTCEKRIAKDCEYKVEFCSLQCYQAQQETTMNEELRKAIDDLLNKFHLEDYVYNIREQASGSEDGFEGNSWDHPDVLRFSEIVTTLKKAI